MGLSRAFNDEGKEHERDLVYPAKRRNRHSVAGSQFMAGRAVPVERVPVRRSNTMPPNLGNSGILGRAVAEERTSAAQCIFTSSTYTCHSGMNVTLKFQSPSGIASGWVKRSGSDKYICYCQDRTPTRPRDQEESFNGRVKGMDCDKLNDTFSVTVSNLTPNDSGPYEFHGVDSDGRRFSKTTTLNVTDPGHPVGPVVAALGLFVFAAAVIICFVSYRKRTKKQRNASLQLSPA